MPAIYDWRTRAIKAEEENKKLRSELGGMRKAVPGNPMDWPLPCDVTIGAGTIKAGCSLNALVARAQALHDLNNILLQARRDAAAAVPEAPKRKPLTVDGLLDLFHERQGEWWKIDFGYFSTVARAIEAAHGIGDEA